MGSEKGYPNLRLQHVQRLRGSETASGELKQIIKKEGTWR